MVVFQPLACVSYISSLSISIAMLSCNNVVQQSVKVSDEYIRTILCRLSPDLLLSVLLVALQLCVLLLNARIYNTTRAYYLFASFAFFLIDWLIDRFIHWDWMISLQSSLYCLSLFYNTLVFQFLFRYSLQIVLHTVFPFQAQILFHGMLALT